VAGDSPAILKQIGFRKTMTVALHDYNAVQVLNESEPRGGSLDAAWPNTPVAHLAFETDNHFVTIDCSPA
jgi:hypothetical protein